MLVKKKLHVFCVLWAGTQAIQINGPLSDGIRYFKQMFTEYY